ncbi:cytosine-specific methyltransferase [Mycobacteroides stephanolepidis]|uniref:DNA (cytosine-5-)-methyltransferase n=1 Tax=[Mycobacterium] stephanolepidis TaxID=1520670 RepID=A0A1Z4F0Z6_9MYCO|nr:DNA cytosine methyltransferase [[Mycobacterium] stephanolepidis]BAX98886.1 cytosine-specific methyltransferase [[Mycobacterium] stephanolepidis]
MRQPSIGSLCSGAGGLDLAVEHVTGGRTIWHAEYDDDAAKVLGTRWPGVPNHRDITAIDWTRVEPADIVCAGYPCQPFSAAGERKGTDDERHLWPYVAQAIRILRPGLVVLENVAGHRSLGFDSVLADLAEMRYVGSWCSLRASDVGATHRRERLFITAHPYDAARDGQWSRQGPRVGTQGSTESPDRLELLPTPQSRDSRGAANPPGRVRDGRLRTVTDDALPDAVIRNLLPTPRRSDGDGGPNPLTRAERMDDVETRVIRLGGRWGKYAPAIERWESLTRPAPDPTQLSRNGKHRLAPAFSEWMMGWPLGWVTAVPISRSAMLRIIGNGVVPQQAVAALYWLLSVSEVAA